MTEFESLQFRLQISCDSAAFDHGMMTEIARILRDVAERVESHEDCGAFIKVRDINGNIIGSCDFALKPTDEFR
jgi:hypothetical protein